MLHCGHLTLTTGVSCLASMRSGHGIVGQLRGRPWPCCVVVVVFIVVVGVAVVKWNGLASMRSGQWDSCEVDLGLPCVGPGRLHWQVSRPPEAHPSAPLAFKPSS